jgi:hypothetical protein
MFYQLCHFSFQRWDYEVRQLLWTFNPIFVPVTLIQQSPSGTTSPRCPVRIKFVLSVCDLIPVFAPCTAKNTSLEGTLNCLTSFVVFGNSCVLMSSQRPRSCKTNVLHSGPYASASSRTAADHFPSPACA